VNRRRRISAKIAPLSLPIVAVDFGVSWDMPKSGSAKVGIYLSRLFRGSDQVGRSLDRSGYFRSWPLAALSPHRFRP